MATAGVRGEVGAVLAILVLIVTGLALHYDGDMPHGSFLESTTVIVSFGLAVYADRVIARAIGD
jgi:type IV secretory pathway VirB2 component (pilin)